MSRNEPSSPFQNIRQITVRYDRRPAYLQLTYRAADGSSIVGGNLGESRDGTSVTTITLGDSDYVASAFGEVSGGAVMALGFVVKSSRGNSTTYGPYGTMGSRGASVYNFVPQGTILSLYGAYGASYINQIGFYDRQPPRCAQMLPGGNGNWKLVSCTQKLDTVSFVCQAKPTTSEIDCPDAGYARFGAMCYRVYSSNQLSWESARLQCMGLQATLAKVDSMDLNTFINDLIGDTPAFIGLK